MNVTLYDSWVGIDYYWPAPAQLSIHIIDKSGLCFLFQCMSVCYDSLHTWHILLWLNCLYIIMDFEIY